MIMNSPEITKSNLKKVMLYTFWGLVAVVLLVAALLLTHAVRISSASAAVTSTRSIGLLGGGYTLVKDAVGSRIVYPYQVISLGSPTTIGPLGSGYSLVTGADGTQIIYPYLAKSYPSGVATSSKSIGSLGSGYTLVTDADGIHIVYPYQAKLYNQTPKTDSASTR
jgi:hypothetical protein